MILAVESQNPYFNNDGYLHTGLVIRPPWDVPFILVTHYSQTIPLSLGYYTRLSYRIFRDHIWRAIADPDLPGVSALTPNGMQPPGLRSTHRVARQGRRSGACRAQSESSSDAFNV